MASQNDCYEPPNNENELSKKTQPVKRKKGQARSSKELACLTCRPRKIKCERIDGVCERCKSLNIVCRLPERDERRFRYSKDYIVLLENQIAELRTVVAELQQDRQNQLLSPVQESPNTEGSPRRSPGRLSSPLRTLEASVHHDTQPQLAPSPQNSDTSAAPSMGTELSSATGGRLAKSSTESEAGESLITRLCRARGRLNSTNEGQLRYFGPTSSLHLTESVTSIFRYCNDVAKFGPDLEKDIPWAMQQYLLDLYWKYQHNLLLVVHKEAFLAGMETEQSPYFSRCLLLCMLASAARISDSPEIRALSIPVDEGTPNETAILTKRAEEALEQELKNPRLTTISSLILLSVLDCAQSNDSRGWMRAGNACRLAFDLGLHQDWSHLSQSNLTAIDAEVRSVVFWGCFSLDRLWGLYIGRPPVINLSDVSISRPDPNGHSWDTKVLAAWVELLDLAGQISERLNSNVCFQEQIDFYMTALEHWDSSLDPTLTWFPQAPPAIYQLRIQYSSLTILLNKHNAGFGNTETQQDSATAISRRVCVDHAFQISTLVQDYDLHHGGAATMTGSALYNITMAATIFIAEISERDRDVVSSDKLTALTLCLDAMKKMEGVEIVARNVRKIVQTIMRVCGVQNRRDYSVEQVGVDIAARAASASVKDVFTNTSASANANTSTHHGHEPSGTGNDSGNLHMYQDLMDFNFDQGILDSVLQFPFEEALMDPTSALRITQKDGI